VANPRSNMPSALHLMVRVPENELKYNRLYDRLIYLCIIFFSISAETTDTLVMHGRVFMNIEILFLNDYVILVCS
jgi:hypothetical protein